ncbi:NADPH-dependent methylglyoxal reductase GRE2 [Spathaspora passalidarum NRRL Y-27907]|uniref:NADPH-dependent methylglyoxal reductase GRE2 n=1 Tax=Spathaspora passalidarum (strain NRRL Y-27907 / 11-Y1) TaxID=619300 RepID=G3AUC9_SPAPN|nr:NADPH-dependent methylglyoxal reductase GRE2 [Spathaspora passalidarum NRRL Y-27907]EGW30505.1 NADPH-dependent methylglyoxal reductase GRE2 [Spathaspora passalidarum NRRL Y-27907]
MSATVFVSGATGFIAQHVVKTLLSSNYKVIGSVRSTTKGDHLKSLLNSPNFSYEIVEDVEKEGAFDQALQKHPEVTVFLHTASPFHFKATDIEKELLLPAVNGTKNALNAIHKYGSNVSRVVITSSYAAISTASKEVDPNVVVTEQSWNEISWEDAKKDPVSGYRGSKTFAEKAAWEFVKEHNPKFVVSTINPSFVFGPQAYDSEVKDSLNTSSEFINAILKNGPDATIAPTRGGFVDVRDVAKAHLVAFEKEEAKNQRLILNAGRFTLQSIIDILNENIPELKGKIPVGEPGTDKAAIAGLSTIDNSKSLAILGFELIDLKKSVVDSVQQILQARK